MNTRILATATAISASAMLAGCYVIPIGADPRYTPSEQVAAAITGGKPPAPAAAPQAGPTNLQARLYPLNDVAGGMGPLMVTLIDNASGHASFTLAYGGEILQGEATRVGPNYPGFGSVHAQVYGDGRMPAGQRGIASAAGARGLFVNCEYALTAPNRGAGACLFSNGAKYQVHFGT